MRRVSSAIMNSDMQNNLRMREAQLNKANNRMTSQQKIQQLRDDPLAVGHLVRYQSYAGRLERFEQNTKTLSDSFSISEGYVNGNLQIMHRVRELAITGATGTFNADDLKNMATEVNQLLQELLTNANAVGPDGTSLFAGTRSTTEAFATTYGPVSGANEALITSVQYNGNIAKSSVEVDERQFMEVNRAGNQIFWAEKQTILSNRDASAYRVPEDSEIVVDGYNIKLTAGDNIHAVIAKINDSGAAVKASLDSMSNGINMQTTDSRQLWLEDVGGAQVLNDLGLIKNSGQLPPNNISAESKSGGSIFDTVIALRDAMIVGDTESIGGKLLGSLDSGIGNLTNHLAQSGAQYERVSENLARVQNHIPNVQNMIAREGDLDFTKAITDLKLLDYVHQASLSTASKLYSNKLLNYLR